VALFLPYKVLFSYTKCCRGITINTSMPFVVTMISSWHYFFILTIFSIITYSMLIIFFYSYTTIKMILCSLYYHLIPEPQPLIISILEQVGFAEITKLRHLKVDHALVIDLVEGVETYIINISPSNRWVYHETANVTLRLCLKVDGLTLIGPTMFDFEKMCNIYLGVEPIKGKLLICSQV